MINIIDKTNCCGCSACVSICPRHCISMVEDDEGFLYPIVNIENCIDCGICEKVCNELYPYDKREPIKVLAAINKNDKIRCKSSSGGIFYCLAENIVKEGGVVFGARFDNNWQVVIDYTDTIQGIESFMGSKYVQARIETAYVDAKKFLSEGRKVLFSGTPCQVAGLHKFLRKKYDNLLSVDFICHGVPSPKVWSMYIDNIVGDINSIRSISFRNKTNGWKCLHFSIDTETACFTSSADQNQYMRAFLSDLILRPSCSFCKVKSCSSQSDITLADFWNIWNINPQMYDNKGTSLLLINTEKGMKFLPSDNNVVYANADYEDVKKYNKACVVSVVPHPKRIKFFEQLHKTKCVVSLIERTLATSFIKQYIKEFILLIKK